MFFLKALLYAMMVLICLGGCKADPEDLRYSLPRAADNLPETAADVALLPLTCNLIEQVGDNVSYSCDFLEGAFENPVLHGFLPDGKARLVSFLSFAVSETEGSVIIASVSASSLVGLTSLYIAGMHDGRMKRTPVQGLLETIDFTAIVPSGEPEPSPSTAPTPTLEPSPTAEPTVEPSPSGTPTPDPTPTPAT